VVKDKKHPGPRLSFCIILITDPICSASFSGLSWMRIRHKQQQWTGACVAWVLFCTLKLQSFNVYDDSLSHFL